MKATQNQKNIRMIIALAVCSLLLVAAELLISQGISMQFSKIVQEQREASVSKMAQMAYRTIQPILSELRSGAIDSTDARKQITDIVRNMTYNDGYGNNYIFMSSYDGIMLVQPYEPGKEGSDQWDLQDSEGRYIIRELVRAAKEKPAGSFVSYHYYLPSIDQVEEKLSYVIGIPEIEAYIGTGMYIESSYKNLQKVLTYQRYGYLFVSLLIFSVAAFYIRMLIRTNQSLVYEIKEREYAESNIRTVFDSIHDAVMIHDQNGRIIKANKQASLLYGVPDNQLVNYSIKDISSDDHDPQEKLKEAENLKSESLVFEWISRRPLENTLFDAEVALRRTKWSGEDVIVAAVRDISERKAHEAEIRQYAYYDYLTSLHNRAYMINELKRELEKGKQGKAEGAVVFIDLDDFKKINDTFGHFFGDEVLRILAERLEKLSSDNFLPARIGGDEFVILCYGSGTKQAEQIAERILNVFRDPIALHDSVIRLTCSLGIAEYPKDGCSVEALFKNADLALYSAKGLGKDSYAFYRDFMSAELQYKSELEEQLRHAYHNREFVLYYQPLYDLRKKKIIGYEALIRWNSPRYGLVMPNRIIPLAEETGLIDRIGDWVIDTAFAFAKRIAHSGAYVSCNVSPAQLSKKDFVEDVIKKFEKYGLEKGSVALEITESCLIEESLDVVTLKLLRLKEKGILIYLDDFGSGYSSLNYLKNLPVDCIKIDRTFIGEISRAGMESKIMNTIITLAHDLGIGTVAEGVETEDQMEFLTQCECDMIQGYLISRPKPEEELDLIS